MIGERNCPNNTEIFTNPANNKCTVKCFSDPGNQRDVNKWRDLLIMPTVISSLDLSLRSSERDGALWLANGMENEVSWRCGGLHDGPIRAEGRRSNTSREKHLNLGRIGARTYEQCAVPICISAAGAQRERQGERRRRIIYCAVTGSRYRASTIYRLGACDTHCRLAFGARLSTRSRLHDGFV